MESPTNQGAVAHELGKSAKIDRQVAEIMAALVLKLANEGIDLYKVILTESEIKRIDGIFRDCQHLQTTSPLAAHATWLCEKAMQLYFVNQANRARFSQMLEQWARYMVLHEDAR